MTRQSNKPPENSASDEMAGRLKESELDYFRAGAQVQSTLNGMLACLPGFEKLPAGCVLHDVDGSSVNRNFIDWLSRTEAKFLNLKASLCRIYVTANVQLVKERMAKQGYKTVCEIGLVAPSDNYEVNASDIELIQILTGDQLRERQTIYKAAQQGADGHDMAGASFSDLEKVKQETGYMTSYLVHYRDLPVATVSLSIKRDFARLKNLLIHPNYRGQGLGRNIVKSLMQEAHQRGATHLGAYAEEGKGGHRTYLACGMRPLTSQTEFCKETGG